MRLLLALPDQALCRAVELALQDGTWEMECCVSGSAVLCGAARCDVLVLHSCLCGLDGCAAGDQLALDPPLCPPRVLLAAPPEFLRSRPAWADAVVHSGVSAEGIARLIAAIAKKPLPSLAAAHRADIAAAVEDFLNALGLTQALKGRIYAAWLLRQLVPSPLWEQESMNTLYLSCARAHSTSAAAVERSLRVAVERVFTHGSLRSIECFFGDAADPDRGKLTNRAFLLCACHRLRYSLTAARSPNSSEMHHSPAAPTRV